MSDASDAHLVDVARAIQRYLAEHPGAADSETGIAEWWLPTLGVEASVLVVRGALEQLLAQDRIERINVSGGQVIWRARQALADNGEMN
ncbi:hypothetical protein [Uliginosibacterium sp. H1]|uniref:hypothetical protein n=1 Tax=Uliginosibacterium sp. H1 TaxID=3114757 RepID=UPI002E187873|nr:hypothetical protein [Uliginosibacterium sp. H1]